MWLVFGDRASAFANALAPFERVVEAVAPARDAGRSPLFQAFLSLEPASPLETMAGLRVERFALPAHGESFDVTLALRENEGALGGDLFYDAARKNVQYTRDKYPPMMLRGLEETWIE